jgi:filamentous hemagglutinin
MPASDDPNSAALEYVAKIRNGQTPVSIQPISGLPGAFVVKMPDGTYRTYRPAGQAAEKTPSTTATVEVNNDAINLLNAGKALKLKFPQR